MHSTTLESAPTLAAMIASRAATDPDATAIRAPQHRALSYGELEIAMSGIARTLRDAGIGPRDRVALALPNGPEMAVGFLGIAASAICAPLNPALKEGEFEAAFIDLGITAVVADGDRIPAAAAAARRRSLPLLDIRDRRDDSRAVSMPAPDDVALLLQTSGTTARPKTVPLTQRNLCASAENIARWLELAPADACLNVMPLFHIHGLVAALLASLAGGASVICTPGFHGSSFRDWLRRDAPTWYTAVPTIHQAVLDACGGSRVENSLRFIRSSSAPLPPRLMSELAACFGVPVLEAYGMTEASHQMASNPLPPGAQKPGSVGLPAGAEIAVMAESGALLPTGSVGEIVIRGATVTRGYEAGDAANAAAFRDGWFRTGDQGRFDTDGYLFLTGRLKELINRGGEKIAPREVEEALLQHEGVAQAVAFPLPHARLGEEVAAAVVLRPGTAVGVADLRAAAEAHLAYFKVPRVIVIVETIPKGATGKVQRNGLAERLGLMDRPVETGEAPRSEPEASAAAEWARLLGVESVGVHDDFFALGGDSLAATEMIEAMEGLLGFAVPIAEFLERPTVAGLMALCERAPELGVAAGDVVTLRGSGGAVPIFCTCSHDGSLFRVSQLVRLLPPQHPVFGFPPPAIGARGPLPTIESMAEQNLAALERIQPNGPVHLIGPCFGGAVALEMASQLERRGRAVRLLVVANTNHRNRIRAPRPTLALRGRHLLQRIDHQVARLRALPTGERWAYVRSRLNLATAHWRFAAGCVAFKLCERVGVTRPRSLRQFQYASRWAQETYVPQTYSGPALLVRAAAPIAGFYPLPLMGWGEVLRGPVEMHEAPCEQIEFWRDESMLRPVAARICEILEASPRASGRGRDESPRHRESALAGEAEAGQ